MNSSSLKLDKLKIRYIALDPSQFLAASHRTYLPIVLSPNSEVFSTGTLWAHLFSEDDSK